MLVIFVRSGTHFAINNRRQLAARPTGRGSHPAGAVESGDRFGILQSFRRIPPPWESDVEGARWLVRVRFQLTLPLDSSAVEQPSKNGGSRVRVPLRKLSSHDSDFCSTRRQRKAQAPAAGPTRCPGLLGRQGVRSRAAGRNVALGRKPKSLPVPLARSGDLPARVGQGIRRTGVSRQVGARR